MVLVKSNVYRLTHLEAGQLVKTTLKDFQTGNINTSTDANISNYVAKLGAQNVLYDKDYCKCRKTKKQPN